MGRTAKASVLFCMDFIENGGRVVYHELRSGQSLAEGPLWSETWFVIR